MSDDLWQKINVRADETGTSAATIVRLAVDQYIRENALSDYARGYEEGVRDATVAARMDELL